jgi:hypothetical protein
MAGINFICPHCGGKSRIEIMEIDRLRGKIMELERKLEENDLGTLMKMMGMGGNT